MIKKITIVAIILLVFGPSAFSQFNPKAVGKSIVRVEVYDIPGKDPNVCTGFVWKQKNWVVTSLHAMNPKGKIRVLYLNNSYREFNTTPVRVLKKADLVLLEMKSTEMAVPSAVVAITPSMINTNEVRFASEIYALGYNSGAPGTSSRTLKKGSVDPENLKTLIPGKDLTVLGEVGFPSADLHILYFEGSLLPGFSGSPVFDPSGKLVGIGDGGLEKGASNVSWGIPAKYLEELENSNDKMPTNFDEIALLFSASVPVQALPGLAANEPDETLHQGSDEDWSEEDWWEDESYYDPRFEPVTSQDFEFYLTKNRSIDEMAETSESPDELYTISDYVESLGVTLDYDDLRFDIYEDVNYGVIVAVPEYEDFFYEPDEDILLVNYKESHNVDLFYLGWAEDNSQTNFEDFQKDVINYVTPYIEKLWEVSDFQVNDDYSSWMDVGNGKKIAYILMDSQDFDDPEFGGTSWVYLYMTVLMGDDKSFISVASFVMSEEKLKEAQVNRPNCIGMGNSTEDCAYFNSLVKVFAAAHLTTFAW